MKRIAVFMLLVAMLAMGAAAMQVSNPIVGGPNQDRVKNVSFSVVVTNDANQTMTNLSFAPIVDSKYSLTPLSVPVSIAPNSQGTIQLSANIPLNHPGVDATSLRVQPIKIGTFTVAGALDNGTAQSASGELDMQAINQMDIRKARIDCETKSQSLSDGDLVKNLKPGNKCTLDVEVENRFSQNDRNNLKVGGIEFDTIRVQVDSSNSDVDGNGDEDVTNLGANNQDHVTFDITVDDQASAKTTSLTITASGTDLNGALMGEAMIVRMEVVRQQHDLQIRSVQLSPNKVSNCDASNVKFSATILNQGKRDEKKAAIEATATDLKFEKKTQDLDLSKDDSTGVTYLIPVPKGFKPGVVRVDVNTFFDNLASSNQGSVELTIDACGATDNSQQTTTQTQPVVTPVVVQQPPQQVTTVTQPAGTSVAAPKKQASFTDSTAYVALLGVLSVVIFIALVLMVVVLVRRKQP